ncbi:MAG TPA: GMC oxidoreductase [Kamptonema sp.]|nr:GMC oxidoreductase [Kamptonema sp.]
MISGFASEDASIDKLYLFSPPTHFGKVYIDSLKKTQQISKFLSMQIARVLPAIAKQIKSATKDVPGHLKNDENYLVHGLSNLYIASSSVFPTCGYANPTLTIVAIAIRLGDYIKRLYA